MAEVFPDDINNLPDLPNHLDLDGLSDKQEVQDPPTGILVDLGDDKSDPSLVMSLTIVVIMSAIYFSQQNKLIFFEVKKLGLACISMPELKFI